MRVFHMSEQAYPEAWGTHDGSLRVTLSNQMCEPQKAADLFHRYYDEWLLADDLGYDIMANEHHATATCMASSVTVTLAILARQTKKARILVLGYPIANRPDPLRAAEELATIDVVSRGRLEIGFVKGVPYEVPVANMNPVLTMDRFWEAHDFILKALSAHDKPFNWEGEYFHYRHVNVWPRVYQDPYPPIWITTSGKSNARQIGARGHVLATMSVGYQARDLFDAYSEAYRAAGRGEPGIDRFAYLGTVAVASSEKEARRRAEILAEYFRTAVIVHPPFRNPPGYLSAEDNARILKHNGKFPPRFFTRDGRPLNMAAASVQELMDAGIIFCGTPDQVYKQITGFSDAVGGLGNLLMMGQAGHLGHEETVDNLSLFAKEVMPRLKEYSATRGALRCAA